MTDKGYIKIIRTHREEILEMEKFLGRPLHPWEEVHHKNASSQPTGGRIEDILDRLDLRTLP